MADIPSTDSFTQHYLEIQALTQASPVEASEPQPPNTKVFISLPILIAFTAFFLGFGWMLYSRLKSLHTLIGIFIFSFLVGTIGTGVLYINQTSNFASKAAPVIVPQNLVVRNVTQTAAIITFTTDSPTISAVKLYLTKSISGPTRVFTSNHPSTLHRFAINNLEPNTTYRFEVLSSTRWYRYQDQLIEFKTAP